VVDVFTFVMIGIISLPLMLLVAAVVIDGGWRTDTATHRVRCDIILLLLLLLLMMMM